MRKLVLLALVLVMVIGIATAASATVGLAGPFFSAKDGNGYTIAARQPVGHLGLANFTAGAGYIGSLGKGASASLGDSTIAASYDKSTTFISGGIEYTTASKLWTFGGELTGNWNRTKATLAYSGLDDSYKISAAKTDFDIGETVYADYLIKPNWSAEAAYVWTGNEQGWYIAGAYRF